MEEYINEKFQETKKEVTTIITPVSSGAVVLKEYAAALNEMNPVKKGHVSNQRILTGQKPEMRKFRLESLLEVTKDDFIKAGKRISENSKNLKACIVTGDMAQACGEIICDLSGMAKL